MKAELSAETERNAAAPVCVSVDPGSARQNPDAAFLKAIERPGGATRYAGGACEVGSADVRLISTGEVALFFVVGPVDRAEADAPVVTLTEVRSRSREMIRRYQMVRRAGRWVVLGTVMKISPA